MIIKTIEQAKKEGRAASSEGWQSIRLLLKDDGMGFSFHITTIFAGADLHMHYKNHLESVYCMSGEGKLEDLATGVVYDITPGTVYALNKHDKHRLTAKSEMTMACVFNPPVSGSEVHDKDGVYPAAE